MYDPEKAHKAQTEYCESKGYPLFASKRCHRCDQNIYAEEGHPVAAKLPRGRVRLDYSKTKHGYSVETASSDHILNCPFCHASFDD